ncbi:hypothetical protein Hanom_Chr00s023535g01762741 [Helianthus anomalus]
MMNLFRPAKVLDDSGFVIVLGDVVFLKPEQMCFDGYEVLKRVVDVIGQYDGKKLEQLSGMKLRLNLVLWQRLIDDIL